MVASTELPDQGLMPLIRSIFSFHHFSSLNLVWPSGKRLHNYGKSPLYSWVNPLFLWPFSMSQTVSLPGWVDAKNPTIWDAWGHHPVERSLLGHREKLPFVRPFVAGLYPGGQRRASRCQVQALLGRGNITWNDSHVYTQNITKLRAVPETYSDRQPKWVI